MLQILYSLWQIFPRREKAKAIFYSFLFIISNLLELAGLFLLYSFLAALTSPESLSERRLISYLEFVFGSLDYQQTLIILLWAIGIAFLSKNMLLLIKDWLVTRFSSLMASHVHTVALQSYAQRPYFFHLKNGAISLLNRLMNGKTYVELTIREGMAFCYSLLLFILTVGLLLRINFFVNSLLIFSSSLLVTIFYLLVKKKIFEYGKQTLEITRQFSTNQMNLISGIKEITLLDKAHHYIKTNSTLTNDFARITGQVAFIRILPKVFLETVFIILFLCVSVYFLVRGEATTLLPTMGVLVLAAFRIIPALNSMMSFLQQMKTSEYNLKIIINDIKDCPPKTFTSERKSMVLQKTLSVEDIHFSYEPHKKILQEIQFTIQKGTMVGFIGTSGSGKSTLFDILLGVQAPDKGRVLVDGQDIQTNLRGWQSTIGYIPQSIFLSEDSIAKNIALGLDPSQIDPARLKNAIREAQLAEFLQSLPQGIETEIGERGVRISGGQRQRIGIARALYYNPNILFLDEATSALDNQTEENFMNAIKHFHGKKTILIIAHRLSTIEQCDQVFVLEKGRIAYQGTYAAVMNFLQSQQKNVEALLKSASAEKEA